MTTRGENQDAFESPMEICGHFDDAIEPERSKGPGFGSKRRQGNAERQLAGVWAE
jgi:hypothetical protein